MSAFSNESVPVFKGVKKYDKIKLYKKFDKAIDLVYILRI